MEYDTIKELVQQAKAQGTSIAEVVLEAEMEESGQTREELLREMGRSLEVMKAAVQEGKKGELRSASGLIGGDSKTLLQSKKFLGDKLCLKVISYGLAVAEVNACMGRIVAGPTAGSSGIVPAVILALGEEKKLEDEALVMALFTAAGLGTVVARKATLAGAAGGCQAECGVASAMAAGAAVELWGGTPEMVANAFALALKNLLGLVCDPVAGLVEVPCVKRNGFAASHALTAANMALAGIESVIPADEVIESMAQIGSLLPLSLKETSLGGLAVTPTGLKIKESLKLD